MQRYFTNKINDKFITLSEEDTYHITKVMRMGINDKVEVVYDQKLLISRIIELEPLVKVEILEEVVEDKPIERIGNDVQYYNILGVNVPLINLPVFGARSMADIIEVAVTNLKLKDDGFDSAFEFENRMNELLKMKSNL